MTIQKQTIQYDIKINTAEIIRTCNKIEKKFKQAFEINIESWKALMQISYELNNSLLILDNTIQSLNQKTSDFKNGFNELVDKTKIVSENISEILNNIQSVSLTSNAEKAVEKYTELNKIISNIYDSMKLAIDNPMNIELENISLPSTQNNAVKNEQSSEKSYYQKTKENALSGANNLSSTVTTIADLSTDVAGILVGFSLMSGPVGATIGLVALLAKAVMAVSTAIIEVQLNEDNLNNKLLESSDNYRQISDAIKAAGDESDKSFQNQMMNTNGIITYGNAIKTLVDNEGNLIGNKEDLAKAIEGYNTSLGKTALSIDEETGKLMSQAGTIDNLSTTLDNLSAERTAEIYIKTHADEYEQAIVLKEQLEQNRSNMFEEFKKLQETYKQYDLEAILDLTTKMKEDPTKSYSLDIEKLGMKPEKFYEVASSLSLVVGNMQLYSEQLKNIDTEVINPFENVNEMLTNGDNAALQNWSENFNFENKKESMQAYFDEIKKLQDELNQNDEMRNLFGADFYIDEEAEAATREKLKGLKEEFFQVFNQDYDELEEQGLTSGEKLGKGMHEGVVNKLKESKSASEYLKTDVDTGLAAIQTSIAGFIPNTITIPVKFTTMNNPLGLLFPLINASFDDSLEGSVIQPNWSSEAMKSSHLMLNSLQQRIVPTISVGIPVPKLPFENVGSTAITQNVSFNQPIQKPSDVTRAMQKASRNLRKVK
ncbi:MAG: hypothetical protein RR738_02025 [Anaerorhabdus sp.]|uniref:hypothetical protein n=1 Tax=Anaerorhabdus sp. TaxID=1872524 RepID=UPI002FC940A0